MDKNSKAKVSLIVPVYNGKEQLQECIDSILSQTYKHIELILINDCSTDGSDIVCDAAASSDERCVVIHLEERHGQSYARNIGITNSSCEFILFVDCDDALGVGAIAYLLENISTHNADISIGGYTDIGEFAHFKQTMGRACFRNFRTGQNFSGDELSKLLVDSYQMPGGYTILSTIWGKMYKKSIIESNKIRFKTDIHIQEDYVFNFDYLQCVDIAFCSNNSVYSYRSNITGAGSRACLSPLFFKPIVKHFGDNGSRKMEYTMVAYAIKMIFNINNCHIGLFKKRRLVLSVMKDTDVRNSLHHYLPSHKNESRIIPVLIRFNLAFAALLFINIKSMLNRLKDAL